MPGTATYNSSTNRKYLGINLAKYVQDLCAENGKTLIKEIINDLSKCNFIPCLWIRRLNSVKMSVLPSGPIDSLQPQLKSL